MPYYIEHSQEHLDLIGQRIRKAVYTPLAELDVTAWCTKEPVPFSRKTSGRKIELRPGKKWGGLFDCAWMRFVGRVPDSARGKHVVLLIDVSGEACIFDEKGNPVRGLTTPVEAGTDWSLRRTGKKVYHFSESARGGEKVDIWAEAGCNDLLGNYVGAGCLQQAAVAVCNDEMRGLYYDYEVLYGLMNQLPETSARRAEIMHALYQAQIELKDYDEHDARRARKILAPVLKKKGPDPSLSISSLGHSHIDLAWLWPIRETIRKIGRTVATVMDMMERYPDYLFGASQAQLYQWIKDHYPSLYKQIKEKVAQKRWEIQGPMWVESDTHVPSGEALIRQFLYGTEFFRAEFGANVRIVWLPDVFGFTGALPQIIRKCGLEYFMTQKMCWNQVNTFPHHTFIWEGIDGSRVLTHMPPENTYNSEMTAESILKVERQYMDKGVAEHALMLFGIGDGGGGPGGEHLERLKRVKNLSGLPPVTQEFAEKLFKKLDKKYDAYQTWAGELYLEYHRGTYTSQARNKWYNRKMELALRRAEAASLLAGTLAGYKYPQKEIDTIWKEVLLYQFHDILPGSSIKRVYDESLERYAKLHAQTQELAEKADRKWLPQINTTEFEKPVVVFNSLSHERTEWIKADRNWLRVTVPSWGYTVVENTSEKQDHPELKVSSTAMENDLLKVRFNAAGAISSILDKRSGREVLAEAAVANELSVYEDNNNAWDIYYDYQFKPRGRFKLEFMENFIDGPRVISRRKLIFGTSELRQDIILTAGSPRLDFVTEADWRESLKMLRTRFPVSLRADYATCEIQYGNVKRTVNTNTTWDMAKYEVPAQRWVELADPDYGVALMNDSKYGCRVLPDAMELNLLRSPNFPDNQADKGRHKFTYALYPHQGDYRAAGVVDAAADLNVPLVVTSVAARRGSLPAGHSFISTTAPNIVVDSIKKAQADDAWIVRVYESQQRKTDAEIVFGMNIGSVSQVNMIEEKPKKLKPAGNKVRLEFGPFEVHTLKVVPKG